MDAPQRWGRGFGVLASITTAAAVDRPGRAAVGGEPMNLADLAVVAPDVAVAAGLG